MLRRIRYAILGVGHIAQVAMLPGRIIVLSSKKNIGVEYPRPSQKKIYKGVDEPEVIQVSSPHS
ncbi:MAG: hypothetical protein AB7F59_09395 [Bdellovibrionales bacterium]